MFSAKDALKFMDIAIEKRNSVNQDYLDAIFQVSMNANRNMYDELKRRDPIMCQAFKEV